MARVSLDDFFAQELRENPWSDETQEVFDLASQAFSQEVEILAKERAEIGAYLHQARQSHRYSQKELSAITSIDQAEISRIERGLSNPTLDTLLKLAKALGVSLVGVPRTELKPA